MNTFFRFNTAPQRKLRGLVITVFAVLLTHCASGSLRINDAAATAPEKVLLAAEKNNSAVIYEYGSSGFEQQFKDSGITSPAERIYTDRNLTILVTGNNGLYVFGLSDVKPLHIPVAADALADPRIYDLFVDTLSETPTIYITYLTPAGNGVTECSISSPENYQCKTYTTANSELKSNLVHQVLRDTKGGLWFRYSPNEVLGVSRRAADMTWHHYSKQNSNIGENSVSLIRADGEENGFPGVNVWFVTAAGLSRFSYGEKEEWFFYGDKNTFVNKVTQAIGIQSWFTDAIVDITDIDFGPTSVMIANKYALFNFSERNVERFLPETTGGADNLRISGMFMRGGFVYAKIRAHREKNPAIRHLMVFDTAKKKWTDVKYWKLHNSYAEDIVINPFNERNDLLLLKYKDGKTILALMSREDFSLKEIAPPGSDPARK